MQVIKEIYKQHFNANSTQIKSLSGGSINQVYLIQNNNKKYVIKVNDKNVFQGMFEKEAKGLDVLSKSNFKIPAVIGHGELENTSYLILEYIEPGRNIDWELFGSKLAHLHLNSNVYFGLDHDNYIGSLEQKNTNKKTWVEFYEQMRIMPLVQRLFAFSLLDENEVRMAENLCKKLPDLLPVENPSLIHGDLWSGNLICDRQGEPVLIDPAIYYGFREMDLAMLNLFGSIPSSAIDAYQDVFPLYNGWKNRIEINQLYPLLVHLVLFGSSYYNSVINILRKYS